MVGRVRHGGIVRLRAKGLFSSGLQALVEGLKARRTILQDVSPLPRPAASCTFPQSDVRHGYEIRALKHVL